MTNLKSNQIIFIFIFFILSGTMIYIFNSDTHQADFAAQVEFYSKTNRWQFELVADMDHASKVLPPSGQPPKKTYWQSFLQKGTITKDPITNKYSIEWKEKHQVKTILNEGGRAMELSALVRYHDKLYTCCDRTGIVYELVSRDSKFVAIARYILMDGSGENAKGFKCEWATIKNDLMYIGSFGKEWSNEKGEFVNGNPMWIKIIDKNGIIKHENWRPVWDKLRKETGTNLPGYMFHEAVVWNPVTKKWYFLPRRVSVEAYHPKKDEEKGANIMLVTDEHFSNVEIIHIESPSRPTRGFSCFGFIPGTTDILAVKSEEIDDKASSYIMIFDSTGKLLFGETIFDSSVKFEGMEFEKLHLA